LTDVQYVDPSILQPHPDRGVFKTIPDENDGAYLRIYQSVEERGIDHPVKVQQETGVIIAGHTRTEIAIALGIQVPVMYLDVDDETARDMMVRDNWERAVDEPDLIKRARVLRTYQESRGFGHGGNRASGTGAHLLSTEELALLFSMGERQFRKYVKLLDLVEPLQTVVSRGIMGVKAGSLIATLEVWRQNAFYDSIKSHLDDPGFTVSESLARSYRDNCRPPESEDGQEQSDWTSVFVSNDDQQPPSNTKDSVMNEGTSISSVVVMPTVVEPVEDGGSQDNRLSQIDQTYQMRSKLEPNPMDSNKRRHIAMTARAFGDPTEQLSFYRRAARLTLQQVENTLLRQESELTSVLTQPSVTQEEDIEGHLERITLILQRFQEKVVALKPVLVDG
jgi:hypothetical protein